MENNPLAPEVTEWLQEMDDEGAFEAGAEVYEADEEEDEKING
jgi:hypothetical protein